MLNFLKPEVWQNAASEALRIARINLKAKPAPMLAASPKGTVPVLVLADGTVADVCESNVQCSALMVDCGASYAPSSSQNKSSLLRQRSG